MTSPRCAFGVGRKKAAVAHMAAAADHHQVHAGDGAVDGAGDDVGIDAAIGLDVLPRLDARKRAHLVAVGRGFLVALRVRSVSSCRSARITSSSRPSRKRIAFARPRHKARARSCPCRARCSGGSGAADRAASGSRTPCPRRCAGGTPAAGAGCSRAPHTRAGTGRNSGCAGPSRPGETPGAETGARHHQVGIGLVVAEQDVVARCLALDEVVLEQQRLAFRARGGDFDRRNLRQHHLDARARGLLG